MPSYTYKVPDKWVKKYGINPNPSSPSGFNRISIGQDAIALFPMEVAVADGVKLYKSRITGKYLLSGRAQESSSEESQPLFNNRAIIDLQTEISTDAINIHPIKRCGKCTSCTECKKPHKPTRERQEAHEKLVKSCLTLNPEPDGTQRYTAAYPHNDLLSNLPVYDEEVKSMMQQLETRLVKLNLVDKFNAAVADFIRYNCFSRKLGRFTEILCSPLLFIEVRPVSDNKITHLYKRFIQEKSFRRVLQ